MKSIGWIAGVLGLGFLCSCTEPDAGEEAESGTPSSESAGSQTDGSDGTDAASDSDSQGSSGATTGAGSETGSADETGTDTGLGEDAQKLEFRVGDYSVPALGTYYACFEFTLTLEQLGHIIAFEPKIDNSLYVHHFVLTEIDAPTGKSDGYSCIDLAGDVLWAWAPGQQTFELPAEAGYLVGDNPGGKAHLRLQVHYNNPNQDVGQIDDSGFDMWVTKELRPENAGTLIFGDVEGIMIPPGEPAYEHIMTCRSEVTASQFVEPLHVFGTSMHAHNIGSVLYTEVWRDGQMIFELNRDDPYLFDSQHIKFVDEVLEPGDEIVNHCIYDSTDRKDVTLGGIGTQDEMCWNTIVYYPKIPSGFDWCTSYN